MNRRVSELILEAEWNDLMKKYEREESDEIVRMLEIVEEEVKKRKTLS